MYGLFFHFISCRSKSLFSVSINFFCDCLSSDSDITKTYAPQATVQPGGNGSNGKGISTGWPSTGSTWPSHLPRRKQSGRDCFSNWISHRWKSTSTLVVPLFYPGQILLVLGSFSVPADDKTYFLGLFRARMGNMRSFGGPLSPNWHNRTVHLQHQILQRMRDLGIIPVLPAFAGYVPRAFIRLFPNANMTKIESWNHFEDKYCWYDTMRSLFFCPRYFLFFIIYLMLFRTI